MPILTHHGVTPRIHPSVFVAAGACVIGEVEVGEDASIWFNAVLRGDINAIRIGARTNVQDGAILHVTHTYAVEIADDVTVGHQAMLHGCRIGRGTLIGMNAVVLDDAQVGTQAIVAAGSVVKEHFVVPDGVLVAGVPARIIRPLTDDEQKALQESADRYVHYARSYDRP
jgi:carbonic anhydrase/acetyltransferase-like protein (isoleucine patch superfamily)